MYAMCSLAHAQSAGILHLAYCVEPVMPVMHCHCSKDLTHSPMLKMFTSMHAPKGLACLFSQARRPGRQRFTPCRPHASARHQ